MKRLIIVGSPRVNGRSARLAESLFEANIEECPEDELFLVPVSEVEIGPCVACDGCREKSGIILKDADGKEITVQRHRCVFDDDMQTVYDLIDEVDEVIVVSPVFFSGSPSLLKSLLDRLQPYFWARASAGEKRPAVLHVVGEGGDPHGYEALVSEVKSAFAVAGFRLERVYDWVGKIDESGEIIAEAEELDLTSKTVKPDEGAVQRSNASRQRPKLDLSGSGAKARDNKVANRSEKPRNGQSGKGRSKRPSQNKGSNSKGGKRG